MSPQTTFAPAEDLPREVQDTPHWGENYLSCGYSPESDVGLYLRLVRCPFDRHLWCEIFVVYLPGGELLISKSFGKRQGEDGPGANGLSFHCERPFESWTARYRGAARPVTSDTLRAGPLADGGYVPVELDVKHEVTTAMVAHDLGDQFWANGHYEQHCTVTGSLSYADTRLEIDGTGFRDHSIGQRDMTVLDHGVWSLAQFPESDRTLMFMHVLTKDGGVLIDAVADREKAEIENAPLIETAADADSPFEVTLSNGSAKASVRGEVLTTATLGLVGPNEWTLGPHPDGHHVLFESMMRYEWDGETGYGYMERSIAT